MILRNKSRKRIFLSAGIIEPHSQIQIKGKDLPKDAIPYVANGDLYVVKNKSKKNEKQEQTKQQPVINNEENEKKQQISEEESKEEVPQNKKKEESK